MAMASNSTTAVVTVQGMSCNHCKRAVESAALEVEGVEAVSVDLEQGFATVSGSKYDLNAVVDAIKDAGYPAELGS